MSKLERVFGRRLNPASLAARSGGTASPAFPGFPDASSEPVSDTQEPLKNQQVLP
jgi:hypothetical protein